MHDAYKIQLLDDGSVVSAALHELGKGMPDSPRSVYQMAVLFEDFEYEFPRVFIAAPQSKTTLISTESSTHGPAGGRNLRCAWDTPTC